ncbi:cyclic nucleotide-binding and patatin-like phospholipase domain-containing protein [Magnetofaba australis]|uniref:cyclic nucleotide-binding and patatin-like phospholipase domain-containing protein n=1 Tax=Magnetofaba australis TaxID=1472297 RepID=UPI001301E2A8|nr:cyclic nucleotide-binding and patatin-like phospholipase domain-containing protein [Magnetofaba australis]
MSDPLDIIAFLKQQHALKHLPENVLCELADSLEWDIVPAEKNAIVEGKPNNRFFWIHTGHFQVTRKGQLVGWVNDGGLVGEIGLLGETLPVATMTAERDSLILVADFTKIQTLLQQFPAFTAALAKIALNRLTDYQLTGVRDPVMRMAIAPLFDDRKTLKRVVVAAEQAIGECEVLDSELLTRKLGFDPRQKITLEQHAQLLVTLSEMEQGSQTALYLLDPDPTEWNALALRQSKRYLAVARLGDDPSVRPAEQGLWNNQVFSSINIATLLLLEDADNPAPSSACSYDWLHPRQTSSFTRVDISDEQRIGALALHHSARLSRQNQLADITLFKGVNMESLEIADACIEERFLKAGENLCVQGDRANELYIVATGRLTSIRHGKKIGELSVGDVAGEMGLVVADAKRKATLTAKRDSLVLCLSRERFEELKKLLPQVQENLSRILADRITDWNPGETAYTLALVPLGDTPEHLAAFADFTNRLQRALSAMGKARAISVKEVSEQFGCAISTTEESDYGSIILAEWFQQIEQNNHYILLIGEPEPGPWNARIVRQSDHTLLVGLGAQDPTPSAVEREAVEILQRSDTLPDLVLMHPPKALSGHNTRAWLKSRQLRRHYHVRLESLADAARVARFLTNRAIGLVFTGVSSRAIAHVGVLKALQENEIPVDQVIGVSSGSGVAAMVAMGWSWQRIYKEVVKISLEATPRPSYFTLPYVSLMHGREAKKTLTEAYGYALLEDQFIPCKVMAADLRHSELVAIDEGDVWMGVRASSSLPVFWPPVCQDGRVLVDGGILNNTPLQYLDEAVSNGWILVSDPNPPYQPFADVHEYGTVLSGWRILWRRLLRKDRNHYPSLAETIVQSMCIESFRQQEIANSLRDLEQTVFFNKGVASSGYFGLKEKAQIDALMDVTYSHAVEELKQHPTFMEAVASIPR